MSHAVLTSSVSEHWNTPAEIVNMIREVANGRIALDPCSNRYSVVQAEVEYVHPHQDGLSQDWSQDARGGLVYVNPPYGRALAAWAPKIALEAKAGVELLVLVFAKTDTRWFRELAAVSDGVAFLPRRIRFTHGGNELDAATHPSALIYCAGGDTDKARRFADIISRHHPGTLIHLGSWL